MDPQHLLVVDIETVPDREHHAGDDFAKLPFHNVIAIGFLDAQIERQGNLETYTLTDLRCGGEASYSERDLVKSFFGYFERLKPRLVTFNGRSFDLPVLKYRAMAHSIAAPWLHAGDYSYRFRFDWHCDVLEALSDFGASPRAKLTDVCKSFGLPGKIGIDGSQVEEMYRAGLIAEIRNYCETDVLNTYLVYLRFMLHSGKLSPDGYDKAISEIISFIDANKAQRPHLLEFVEACGAASGNRFLIADAPN